jgi:serine/threonine protein kinase
MTKKRTPPMPGSRAELDASALPGTVKVIHVSRAAVEVTSALAPNGVVADRYVLDEQLAKGGMSVLWRATDRRLGREVVVKFLRLEADAELRARFETEARIAASLRSPHIIEVYDVGIEQAVPFMVLERLVGEDLGARLARRHRLMLVEAVWIALQTARGLQVAHRAGVIHRDIKPSNLFIARHLEPDAGELLKILDFGVAKALTASGGAMTRPGVVVGSPLSISPEQVNRSSAVDFRADLFAFAAVLYRCLLGQPPFRGDSFASTLALVAEGRFDAPSKLDPALPAALDAFFARGLAVDPSQRFRSALDLATAFEAAAGLRG